MLTQFQFQKERNCHPNVYTTLSHATWNLIHVINSFSQDCLGITEVNFSLKPQMHFGEYGDYIHIQIPTYRDFCTNLHFVHHISASYKWQQKIFVNTGFQWKEVLWFRQSVNSTVI